MVIQGPLEPNQPEFWVPDACLSSCLWSSYSKKQIANREYLTATLHFLGQTDDTLPVPRLTWKKLMRIADWEASDAKCS